ncbi:recA-like protein [Tsuneonella mangrovi]|uniref:recA-like protein n=1 Tax=Tsuneonella mangrovi TaxID=1982042 RepID=UPI001F0A8725|nr:recA-like protein [Tsuneonella mangrovi]
MSRSTISSHDLVPASELAAISGCAPVWQPGLAPACHSEIFAPGREASGAAVALALAGDALRSARPGETDEAEDRRAILWVQDRAALRLGGRPYRPGLPRAFQHRLLHVVAEKPQDALFALEEGLRCRELAAVIGELAGAPRALDFTASRRLSLAAEKHGVPLWLVRLDAPHDLSSARLRWSVRSAPSAPPRWNGQAPGTPQWHTELFRARAHPPGEWTLRDDGYRLAARRIAASHSAAPDPLGLAAPAGGRSLAAV